METQAPVPELRSLSSKKILFLFVGVFLAALFIAINVWVYKLATKGGASSTVPSSVGSKKSSLPPNVPSGTLAIPVLNVDPIPPRPTSTPTPTPTPLQGSGTYACDPFGSCNHYANPEGIGCPKTFADSQCLGQCGDKSTWCPK